jgi:hypothetical protein
MQIFGWEKEREYTFNVRLRRVNETTFATEKQ